MGYVTMTVYEKQSESRVAYWKATKMEKPSTKMVREISKDSTEGILDNEEEKDASGWRH